MSEMVITLQNRCDDDHTARVVVYQSRPPGETGEDRGKPAWQEVEVPAGAEQTLSVPAGPRYFVGVEDVGPGELRPGLRDTVEVGEGAQTVVVRGSLASGLRVATA